MDLSRDNLISICEDSVIPTYKWKKKDTYFSQKNIADIYSLLIAESEYDAKVEGNTIWIRFHDITDEQKEIAKTIHLEIGKVEDYIREHPEEEIIEKKEMDLSQTYFGGYLPTRLKLEESEGEDWN